MNYKKDAHIKFDVKAPTNMDISVDTYPRWMTESTERTYGASIVIEALSDKKLHL